MFSLFKASCFLIHKSCRNFIQFVVIFQNHIIFDLPASIKEMNSNLFRFFPNPQAFNQF